MLWNLRKYLDKKGVLKTEVGYAGGDKNNVSYEEVCEVIQVMQKLLN